jgi:hypothetical protein
VRLVIVLVGRLGIGLVGRLVFVLALGKWAFSSRGNQWDRRRSHRVVKLITGRIVGGLISSVVGRLVGGVEKVRQSCRWVSWCSRRWLD